MHSDVEQIGKGTEDIVLVIKCFIGLDSYEQPFVLSSTPTYFSSLIFSSGDQYRDVCSSWKRSTKLMPNTQ